MPHGCAKQAQFSNNIRQLVPDADFQLDLVMINARSNILTGALKIDYFWNKDIISFLKQVKQHVKLSNL